jgi:hypothetical protein
VSVDQLVHEGRVVLLLARIEAQVLGELDLGGQPGQLLPDRSEVELGVGGTFGTAQVGAGGDLGPPGQQVLEGGEGGPDAEVVGHRKRVVGARPERNVEVDPDQDAGPVQVGQVPEERQSVQ